MQTSNNNNTVNGRELRIPNWFDHNKDGYIGNIDYLEADDKKIRSNFVDVMRFFRYEPITTSPRLTDISNPMIKNQDVQMEFKRKADEGILMAQVPMPYYNAMSNQIDFKYIKNYTFPNTFNAYLGKKEASSVYGGRTDYVNLPSISKAESVDYRNGDTRYLEQYSPSDPRITNAFATINYLRSTGAYKQRQLKEYIFMTLGESKITLPDGTVKTISASENIIFVPVLRVPNYQLPDSPTAEQLLKSVVIIPAFREQMNKELGGGGSVSKQTVDLINSLDNMSAYQRETIQSVQTMSDQDLIDFNLFKQSRLKAQVESQTALEEPKTDTLDIKEVRQQYELKFGKKPNHLKKIETLLEEINKE